LATTGSAKIIYPDFTDPDGVDAKLASFRIYWMDERAGKAGSLDTLDSGLASMQMTPYNPAAGIFIFNA
jgi:hypothetical protein